MLPFLKDKKEGGMSTAPVEIIERSPDDGPSFEMLDAIVDDLLDAIHRKDKKLLKATLGAFKEHIQEEDEFQDNEKFEET